MTQSQGSPAIAPLVRHGVIPVIRTADGAQAGRAIAWLEEAGYSVFELTLTTPGVLDLLADLKSRTDITVGIGTVMSVQAAQTCLAAGAEFIVSPAMIPAVAATARSFGRPVLLGGATPTEILAAREAGADAVKVFPAASFGGPDHLKALAQVLPDIPLVPTGGVRPDQLGAYRRAGAAFVGLGGELVDTTLLAGDERTRFVANARSILETYHRDPA